MEKLVITGNNKLQGEVKISGAKNSVLPLMAASLLSPGHHEIRNVPNLMDVKTMGKLLAYLGGVSVHEDSRLQIDTSGIHTFEAPYELVKTMRASILLLSPLVAHYGRARVSLPGGCAIGARPINLHLAGLEKMGAEIQLESGYVIAKATRLKAAHICPEIPTVTGTENLMMAAALAEGTTVIDNAAQEPEVVDLANALISMGAQISGAGTSLIEIKGVDTLNPLCYTVIPDRIEAGTFMVAAGITGGDILIKGLVPEHVDAVIDKLSLAGLRFIHEPDGLRVQGPDRPSAQDIRTMPYPGFPTDMQAQFMVLMCVADGTSIIRENIFENRFMHVAELLRLGADIQVEGSIAKIVGVDCLKGAPVMATDLRASASLVLAALCAKDTTEVHRIYHLDRGYERIDEKLACLGAQITRAKA
ncbi:MAG TPA: UDP-N-acetylglucosamine 1-carboxyvinyltransferase [Thermodesulfovibrionia bacterium]|nr:UDP-N-acetylglucosamine 1-carboxyvinyltransferase [Thermodesulfovibrionia bacterium]